MLFLAPIEFPRAVYYGMRRVGVGINENVNGIINQFQPFLLPKIHYHSLLDFMFI
jgi:hypothetical protein